MATLSTPITVCRAQPPRIHAIDPTITMSFHALDFIPGIAVVGYGGQP
jgi:hypothetical protein